MKTTFYLTLECNCGICSQSLLEYLVSLVDYFQFVAGDNLNATITILLYYISAYIVCIINFDV